MADYTVTLTDTEVSALGTVVSDITEWATNVTKERARKAKVVLIEKLLEHCNANDIAIAVGEDAQVAQAIELGVMDSSEPYTDAE